MQQVVNLDKKKYALAYNVRSIILFERIADKPFEVKSLTDWILLVYACILSANSDFLIGFDEFVDKIEQTEIEKAIDFISKKMNVSGQFSENTPLKKK